MYYIVLFRIRDFHIDDKKHQYDNILEHPITKELKLLSTNTPIEDNSGCALIYPPCGDISINSRNVYIFALHTNITSATKIYNKLSKYIIEGTKDVEGDELIVLEINKDNMEAYGPVGLSFTYDCFWKHENK